MIRQFKYECMNVFYIQVIASARFYKEKVPRRTLKFLIIKLSLSAHGPKPSTNTHQT